MGRFNRSWMLAKASANVLKSDKELVLLPVFSMLATLATVATFALPIWATRTETVNDFNQTSTSLGPVGYVLLFLLYVVLAYITIFFNTAIITAADERLRGGDPDLASALRGATSRAGAILPWAIVSATVSMVIRAAEQRAGILGRIVIGLVGMAWAVITFMVLPVIVFEKLTVGKAVKRSAELFKSTWGENLIGNGGIGIVSFLAVLAGVPVLLLCLATRFAPTMVFGIILFVLWVLVVTAVSTALTGIYQVALYRFATDGHAPDAFAGADLGGAFRNKSRRGRRSFGGRPGDVAGPGGGSAWGGQPGGYPPPTPPGAQGWGADQAQPQFPPPGYGQPPSTPPASPDSPGWGGPSPDA